MFKIESKKLLILRILSILEKYSNKNHPITQSQIIKLLKSEYDVECERKAVGRNISFLKEANYDIHSTGNGVYLNNNFFKPSEVRLLVDSIINNDLIGQDRTRELINKVIKMGGDTINFGNDNLSYSTRKNSLDDDLFDNMDTINEAINTNRQLSLEYSTEAFNDVIVNKKDHYIVNSYKIFFHNTKYYLICNINESDDVLFLRIDLMTNLKVLDDYIIPIVNINNHIKGLTENLSAEQTYKFPEKVRKITARISKSVLKDCISWLGDKIEVQEFIGDSHVIVKFDANVDAIKYWATQYRNVFEILDPPNLIKI